jgi:hypothetical protein
MATKIGQLEIDIAANIARLTQDMNAAKSEVSRSTRAIQGHVSEMQRGIAQSMEGVKKSLDMLKGLAALGGIAEVGAKIFELGKSSAEYGDLIERASKKTGIATDALQGLKFAAEQSDVSFDQLQTGLAKLARAMAEAQQGNKNVAAAFQVVGISAANLKNMKVEDVLAKISDKFSTTEDGAAKTAISMQLFGRSGAELIPLLDKGSANLDAMSDKAKSLGLVLDEAAIQKSAAFNEELKQLGAQTKMAGVELGSQLMPAIKMVTDAMSDALKPGGMLSDTFRFMGEALKDLVVGLELTWQSLKVVTAAMAGAIVTLAGVINAALHLDWNGIKAAWEQGLTETRLAVDLEVGDMLKTIQKANEGLSGLGNAEGGKKPGALGQLHIPDLSGGSNLMAQWRAQLDGLKDAEGAYHEMSKQEELAFWQAKLLLVKKGTKDYNAALHEVVNIQRQIYKEQTAEAKAEADEQQKIKLTELTDEASLEKIRLKQVADSNQFLLQSGRITSQQKLARDQEVADQEFAIELTLLSKKLELYQDDARERAKIDAQIEQLNANHLLEMQKSAEAAALSTQKSYEQMLAPITSAFDTSIKGIIMGTQTWQQAVQRSLASILSSFIDMGVQMVGKWASQQLAMTLATTTGNEARMASDQAASATSLTTSAATLIKSILNSASETFAGIFGFLSPVMGPAAAGPAAAGMGTVAAVAGSVASSAGGEWRIPMDRLQFVHKNETILPAHIAGNLRNLVERGGNASSHQIHIHATDAQSVERLFHNNGAALARALQSHLRNFGR